MITLFDHQKQALSAEDAYRRENPTENRLAIVMATGLGKSAVIAERARRFLDSFDGAGNKVLILVHTDELVGQIEQWARLMSESGHTKDAWYSVGVVKAERNEVHADIVVASVQTLANPARRAQITGVGLVIVDECHHAAASTYVEILRHYGCFPDCECKSRDSYGCWDCQNTGWTSPPVPALGVTATLERGDGASLGGIWHNMIFSRDVSWGVRHGFLVQPIGYRIEVPLDGSEMAGADRFTMGNATALDMQMADSIAPERVVDAWFEHATGRPTVLFAPLVRSARAFADAFETRGIKAEVVWGGMDPAERAAALERFAAGITPVICNAMILTEGWDCARKGWPTCIIVARPTKSRPLFIQMAGRGLRRDPLVPVEEQDCIIFTVTDGTTDMCTVADLSDKPIDRRQEGALTAMEDQWDIGQGIEDAARHWTGQVDTTEFDPLARKSSKVWKKTKAGTPFLPIGKDGKYVFIVGTSVFYRHPENYGPGQPRQRWRTDRIHKDLPDLEIALTVAEDEATDLGGDVGALLADQGRAWRKQRPAADSTLVEYARRLGLGGEVDRIMQSPAGGKAGKISDLIDRVVATRAIDPLVIRIRGE